MARRKRADANGAHNERAEAVFAIYRDLGFQRPSLAKFTPWLLQERPELAVSLTTIKDWSAHFHWQDRLQAFDDEVQRESERAHLGFIRRETVKRSAQRLHTATLLREVGLKGMTDADGRALDPHRIVAQPDGSMGPAPYPDPAYLSQWRHCLVQAGNMERLELGLPTERLEQTGTGTPGIQATITVLGADALAELRKIVQMLPDQAAPRIIEGETA